MTINCSYCQAANASDEERCHRCGKRLHVSGLQISSGNPGVTQTATAHALRPAELEVIEPFPQPGAEPEAQPRRAAYQRPLFTSQVVPIESIAPRGERRRPRREPQKPRVRGPIPAQQPLEFMVQPMEVESEPTLYTDARVASVVHRLMAVAVDLSIIAISLALFVGIVQLISGQLMLSKETLPLFLGFAVVFGILYKVLWAMADGDSPGMRYTHLRLVNFDGRRPHREQRLGRIASGGLSFSAAGLGVIWALVDEEKLTWHDHISKTFPTPY